MVWRFCSWLRRTPLPCCLASWSRFGSATAALLNHSVRIADEGMPPKGSTSRGRGAASASAPSTAAAGKVSASDSGNGGSGTDSAQLGNVEAGKGGTALRSKTTVPAFFKSQSLKSKTPVKVSVPPKGLVAGESAPAETADNTGEVVKGFLDPVTAAPPAPDLSSRAAVSLGGAHRKGGASGGTASVALVDPGSDTVSKIQTCCMVGNEVRRNGKEPLEGAEQISSVSATRQNEDLDRNKEDDPLDNFFSLSDASDTSEDAQDKAWPYDDSDQSSFLWGNEPDQSRRREGTIKKNSTIPGSLALGEEATGAMSWDYSFSLASTKGEGTMMAGLGGNDPTSVSPDEITLSTIYQVMMAHREEARSDSSRTHGACRKLQNAIRRMSKTCSEFSTRITEAETRISQLEDNMAIQQAKVESIQSSRDDTVYKLTDLENLARRNNLRILGIPEGQEGANVRQFVVELFEEAFPDLPQWDWKTQIQRAHRFPFNQRHTDSQPNNRPAPS